MFSETETTLPTHITHGKFVGGPNLGARVTVFQEELEQHTLLHILFGDLRYRDVILNPQMGACCGCSGESPTEKSTCCDEVGLLWLTQERTGGSYCEWNRATDRVRHLRRLRNTCLGRCVEFINDRDGLVCQSCGNVIYQGRNTCICRQSLYYTFERIAFYGRSGHGRWRRFGLES
jgi:hypothetical protein